MKNAFLAPKPRGWGSPISGRFGEGRKVLARLAANYLWLLVLIENVQILAQHIDSSLAFRRIRVLRTHLPIARTHGVRHRG